MKFQLGLGRVLLLLLAAVAISSALPQSAWAFGGKPPRPVPPPRVPELRLNPSADLDLLQGPTFAVTTLDEPDLAATKFVPEVAHPSQRKGVVILLTGFTVERTLYQGMAKSIAARGFTVVTYDLLGQGQRTPNDHRYANTPIEGGGHFSAYGTQLDYMVRRYSPDRPVILVGHSWGAGISLRYAMDHPSRVSRLIGISPFTGLPFVDGWEGKEVFRKKYLGGLFGGKANLLIRETFQDLASRLVARKDYWPREVLKIEFADLIARRVRVHLCIKFLIGNRCGDRWVSVSSTDMRQYLQGEHSFDSLTVQGVAPRYLNLINFVQADTALRIDISRMGELSGKKIDLLVASERDPLTPVDTVRPYAYTIADRGAKVMLATYDGGYINELNTTQVPAHSAGHLLIYHPEVQKFVLSRLLEN